MRACVSRRLNTLARNIDTSDSCYPSLSTLNVMSAHTDIKSVCADMTLCAGANARQAEELVAMHSTYLTECLDKHAPWRDVRVRDSTPHPWYDSDIDDARERNGNWRMCGRELI